MQTTPRPDVEGIELTDDVAEAARRIGDGEYRPETLEEAFGLVETAGEEPGSGIELDDIYRSVPTRHAVRFGGRVEHVPCVLDAMIVAWSVDARPVEVRSEPPGGGEPVRISVTEDGVAVTPDGVVASVGIPHGYSGADTAVRDRLDEESAVPAACSLINAFPDPDAYERWAEDVADAAVMRLDVEELVAASRYAARHVVEPTRELDPAIATRLATAFDLERQPSTLAEAVGGMTETLAASLGRQPGPQDLCTTDDSPHEARIGDRSYRYQCVLDAFILGHLLEEAVTVRTVCTGPDEEVVVEFDDAGSTVASAPDGAVMSYGVARTASRPDGEITPEKLYGQLCGYSHVFASHEAYEEWDRSRPDAVTEAWPLAEGIEVARGMASAFDSSAGAGGTTREGPDVDRC